MKLRTKLSVLAALVILAAAAVSDGIIWTISRRSLMREAVQASYHRLALQSADYALYFSRLDRSADPQERVYYFKSHLDDYTVCMYGGRMLYNQTSLTEEQLSEDNFTPIEKILDTGSKQVRETYVTVATGEEGYSFQRLGGSRVLITETMTYDGVHLFAVTDLRDITHRLRMLALGMLAVLTGVTFPAALLLHLLVRRTLRPLGALSESAKSIAAGAYDERAAVHGTDEIGMLAQDFNTMAEAVQEKIRALADSEERKTMFMADFSHELKTPLTAISGYAQTLRTVKLPEEDRAEALHYIYTESKRLDRLSKKMMRLMELDRTGTIEKEPVDLAALLDAARITCKPIADKKGVRVVLGRCEGTVEGDPDLLQDAVCNLIDNALKASAWGKAVTLTAADGVITVQDEGCGIPQEEIRNLTEPFYMVDKSRSRRSGGAGLGLSIVAQIVRLHGAEMEIESTPGRGTAVKLRFVYTTLNT